MFRSSVLSCRSLGGRSGDRLIFICESLRRLALSSHMFRSRRSLKRIMMPALGPCLRRWQAEKSSSLASVMPSFSRASLMQDRRVTFSFSPASPGRPCSVRFHFRRWTSRSRVWNTRASATFWIWLARLGKVVSCRASRSAVKYGYRQLQQRQGPYHSQTWLW